MGQYTAHGLRKQNVYDKRQDRHGSQIHYVNKNNAHNSFLLNVCESHLITHAWQLWIVYDVMRILNVRSYRRSRAIGLHPTRVRRMHHVGYIQASHTVL